MRAMHSPRPQPSGICCIGQAMTILRLSWADFIARRETTNANYAGSRSTVVDRCLHNNALINSAYTQTVSRAMPFIYFETIFAWGAYKLKLGNHCRRLPCAMAHTDLAFVQRKNMRLWGHCGWRGGVTVNAVEPRQSAIRHSSVGDENYHNYVHPTSLKQQIYAEL